MHGASKEHAIPSLVAAVAPTWPFHPEAWSTAGSGTEGTLLAIQAAAGDRRLVAIESPTSPRLLDICTTLGLTLIPVECDECGPAPSSLRQALKRNPAAFIYQPRAQVPLGHHIDQKRLMALASELKRAPETAVIEDDFIGALSFDPGAKHGIDTFRAHAARTRLLQHLWHRSAHVRDWRLVALDGQATTPEK